MKASLASLGKYAWAFFAAAPGAVRDHLNVDEMFRVAVAALLAGGGAHGGPVAQTAHLPQIVPPADASAATAVLAAFVEIYRRLNHGATLPTLPAPGKTTPAP